MIAHSTTAKLAALVIAGGAHAALLVGLVAPDSVQIGGAGSSADARLGTSFRDLVEGGVAAPSVPNAAERVEAERPESTDPITPVRTQATPVNAATVTREITSTTTSAAARADGQHSLPDELTPRAARSAAAIPIEPTDTRILSSSIEVARTVSPATRTGDVTPMNITAEVTLRVPDTVVEALPDEGPAPAVSPRPPSRPDSIVQRAPTTVATSRPSAPRPPAPQPSTAGNADRTAIAGSASGQGDAASPRAGASDPQDAPGNAAASNYPGQVMRCISRVGRPRVTSRGTAIVSFRISGNGGVTSVALAGSSGDAGLDRAAVQTISRAGPCPAPPPGAQTAFSIRVQGR